jgi:hypothetical protein
VSSTIDFLHFMRFFCLMSISHLLGFFSFKKVLSRAVGKSGRQIYSDSSINLILYTVTYSEIHDNRLLNWIISVVGHSLQHVNIAKPTCPTSLPLHLHFPIKHLYEICTPSIFRTRSRHNGHLRVVLSISSAHSLQAKTCPQGRNTQFRSRS